MGISLIIFAVILVAANIYFVFDPMIRERKTDKYVK